MTRRDDSDPDDRPAGVRLRVPRARRRWFERERPPEDEIVTAESVTAAQHWHESGWNPADGR